MHALSAPAARQEQLGFNEEDAAWSELAMGNWPGGEIGGEMYDPSGGL